MAADKIYTANNILFAVAGLTSSDDGSFDASKIIRQELENEGSFSDVVQNAQDAIEVPLGNAVRLIHGSRPEEFKKFLARRDALEVVFAAKSDGEIALIQMAFKAKRRGKDVILEARQSKYPNRNTNISSLEFVTAGVDDVVVNDFKKTANPQEALVYPETALKKFMDMVIAAEPSHTSYPINIAKLAESGITFTTIESA
ncbi:MAG: hypothetical protein ACAH83_05900 [Alphaproteobacteria bacterium]